MYTRSYTDEPSGIMIPEGYDGAALRQGPSEDILPPPDITENKNPWEVGDETVEASADARDSEERGSILASLPFGNYLSSFFKKGRFSLQNIGFEELLIAGVALYLLFSKDGDKECAIMLLILLFIT